MSRGGRGGGRGGLNALPIDIDPSFLEEANRFAEEQNRMHANREKKNGLASDLPDAFFWPTYPGGITRAPLPSRRERSIYEIGRRRRERLAHGPFWTGDPGQVSDLLLRAAHNPAHFDAFNDRNTYANRLRGPKFRLPDLTRHKWVNPGVSHPAELWAVIGYKPDTYERDRKLRKAQVVKKTRDPLAAILDDDDDVAEKPAAEEDEVAAGDDVDEEGGEDEPQDDDFDEDDDDLDNDYNAEQYFDGGEDDYDEMGDDGGGDD